MIKVCLADNYPIVHIGLKSYFNDHIDISIVANVGDFLMLKDTLLTKEIDVLVLDLELKGIYKWYSPVKFHHPKDSF